LKLEKARRELKQKHYRYRKREKQYFDFDGYIFDNTSSLLPHERAPAVVVGSSHHMTVPRHHYRQSNHNQNHPPHHAVSYNGQYTSSTSSSASASASLHHILTLHPRQIARLEREREEILEEEEGEEDEEQGLQRCMLSRIDCIEVGLWHERIKDYEAAELGMVRAEELGLLLPRQGEVGREGEGGGDEGRLSRVDTHVDASTSITDFADVEGGRGGKSKVNRSRKTSSVTRFGSVSLSLNHVHPFFWVDMLGICSLVLLILALLLYIGLQLRGLDKKQICAKDGGGLWVAVQMLVGLSAGLILQIPVSRRLVPFVLPVWVVVTIGVVIGLKEWAGCLGE
ncbi:hypothetical protein D6C83_03185, partial [Aureobasidium pullulans]